MKEVVIGHLAISLIWQTGDITLDDHVPTIFYVPTAEVTLISNKETNKKLQ